MRFRPIPMTSAIYASAMPRVLVVDDDPTVSEVVGRYLQSSGYDVDTVGDGAAALEKAATDPPDLVVLDLREEKVIYAGNRFLIYALFPETNISIHVLWGLKNQNTVFATGKSILNRSSNTNIGALMLSYGGGGHEAAGTCQVAHDDADRVLLEIAAHVNAVAGVR